MRVGRILLVVVLLLSFSLGLYLGYASARQTAPVAKNPVEEYLRENYGVSSVEELIAKYKTEILSTMPVETGQYSSVNEPVLNDKIVSSNAKVISAVDPVLLSSSAVLIVSFVTLFNLIRGRRKELVLILIIILAGVSSGISVGQVLAQTTNQRTLISAYTRGDWDALVFKDGDNTIAVDKQWNVIARDIDPSKVIQRVIDTLTNATIYIMDGTYTPLSIVLISGGKSVHIICQRGVVFDLSQVSDLSLRGVFKGEDFTEFTFRGGKIINYNINPFWFKNGNFLKIENVQLELPPSYTPSNDGFTRIFAESIDIVIFRNILVKENFQVDGPATYTRKCETVWYLNNYFEKTVDYGIFASAKYVYIRNNIQVESRWGLAYVSGNPYGYATDVYFEIIGNVCIITNASGSANYAAILLREEGSGLPFRGVVIGNIIENAYKRGIYLRDNSSFIVISNNVIKVPTISQAIEESGTSDYNIITHNIIISGEIVKRGPHTKVEDNIGFITENTGIAYGLKDGDFIPHGLVGTPTNVILTCLNATYDGIPVIVSWNKALTNSTHIAVNIMWANGTAITDPVIAVSWRAEYNP